MRLIFGTSCTKAKEDMRLHGELTGSAQDPGTFLIQIGLFPHVEAPAANVKLCYSDGPSMTSSILVTACRRNTCQVYTYFTSMFLMAVTFIVVVNFTDPVTFCGLCSAVELYVGV